MSCARWCLDGIEPCVSVTPEEVESIQHRSDIVEVLLTVGSKASTADVRRMFSMD